MATTFRLKTFKSLPTTDDDAVTDGEDSVNLYLVGGTTCPERAEIMKSVRSQYFETLDEKMDEEDCSSMRLAQYVFDKGCSKFCVVLMNNKAGDIHKVIKSFSWKCSVLVWTMALTQCVDLVALQANLNSFSECASDRKLTDTRFVIIFTQNDSFSSFLETSPFPLTDTESTTDTTEIKRLLEKAYLQQFEAGLSVAGRQLEFRYLNSQDSDLFTQFKLLSESVAS